MYFGKLCKNIFVLVFLLIFSLTIYAKDTDKMSEEEFLDFVMTQSTNLSCEVYVTAFKACYVELSNNKESKSKEEIKQLHVKRILTELKRNMPSFMTDVSSFDTMTTLFAEEGCERSFAVYQKNIIVDKQYEDMLYENCIKETLASLDLEKGLSFFNQGKYSKALELFTKACNSGNANACYNIGYMYSNGHGVNQDYSAALNPYKKACEMNISEACFDVGVTYMKMGVSGGNVARAEYYFSKACRMGYKKGCYVKQELEEVLNNRQN